ATGMVGRKMLQVLAEFEFPIKQLIPFASARSAGSKIIYKGQEVTVEELTETCMVGRDIDIALLSAGGSTSQKFAPLFAAAGAAVVDNSSCWRMDKNVPLVVPEVKAADLDWHNGIIANPNCSTIQAVVALQPLHEAFGLKRVIYSTYQAVSGAGVAGFADLENGAKGLPPQKFAHPIYANLIPQIDVFLDSGYTKEEQKMIDETRKIMGLPELAATATCVRVPVFHGHSESINCEFERPVTVAAAREALEKAPGIVVVDDIAAGLYPMPIHAEDHNETYVGRIRIDESAANGLAFWCVSDNIRKGAATNTVQIALELIKRGQVHGAIDN
ncbi:MAG: aspartate-semialdehyde dehydrogenase, partial [Clostridia bacterium]|nr:aspartate-semialdehyde dehydrogenase [Clostridia bacterium]